MSVPTKKVLGFAVLGILLLFGQGPAPACPSGPPSARPLSVLVLLGEWFGDAYFPLAKEIEARGWTMKRVGVEAEYRGCYNKARDIVLRSDILIPDLKDLSGFDCLVIPSGPQFRKFREDPAVLKFIRDAHASGLLVASFCVGNFLVQDAGLVDGLSGQDSFPKEMTLARERVLIGPRGGGPPPGDGFESAPIKELCDAIARERAREKAPAAPAAGGAEVWYLGHCGYAVRTSDHLLVFDYQERTDGRQPKSRPDRPSLANGWIAPEEIKGLKVRVFVSHAHEDHFDPVILTWKEAAPDIAYYFGWKATDDPSHHVLAGPRAELAADGLEIATINSHHSGVPEVAWLVKVDGLVIYHNGDCLPSDPAAEHDFLKTKADTIDLAFVFPVTAPGERYTVQEEDFFRKFQVRAAFPMHARAGDAMYLDFQRSFGAKFPGLPIRVPMRMGQKFVYANGRIGE
jgi:L-ascorbate metabolism protein UlaG (beta-lactamase superfamily)